MVKLLRNFLEVIAPDVIILTETNVPHDDNISYFGRGDEAHMVYQFALPPLVLHGLLNGTAAHLTEWASNLIPPPRGCSFLNFTASHDGIGVRPLEGILPVQEISNLAEQVEARGGFVSMRSLEDGSEVPYELNTTFFGALVEPEDDTVGEARFLCSQAVALAMQGIPAVYFHSLTATPNDIQGVEQTGQNRSINRPKWEHSELADILGNSECISARVFDWLTRLLRRRASCPAFHPDAPQFVQKYGSDLFAVERTSLDGSQTVICLFNFTNNSVPIPAAINMKELFSDGTARDLAGGSDIPIGPKGIVLRPYQTLWLVPL